MKPPARINLRLLGGFALTQDGEAAPPIELTSRKAMALVAYLAMQPEQSASREVLATLLWSNSSDQQARHSLRQVLASLRRDLPWPYLFVIGKNSIRLQQGVWSADAREFDALTTSTDADDIARAGRLFRGEFLAGFGLEEEGFDEWLCDQRRRVDLAADRLGAIYATRQAIEDGQEAIAFAERLIAIDPLREDRWRWALALYTRYRGRDEALAQAEALAALLQRELSVKPEPETRALIEDIRRGALNPAPPEDAINTPAVPEPAPPSEAEPHSVAPPAVPARPRHPPRGIFSRWSGRALAAGLAVAAMILSVGIFLPALKGSTPRAGAVAVNDPAHTATVAADPWRSPPLPSRAAGDAPQERVNTAIVVLPFTTYGETAGSMELLAAQMTDDLTNILARVPNLRVISRQTARRYQGKPIDVAAIGAELGVRYVLEGNMRVAGDKLRVNVELINPKTRMPVWSDRIERPADNPYAVQDEIIGRLARELQFTVMQVEADRPAANPGLATLLLRGWAAHFSEGTRGADGAHAAESYIREALARDPNNVSAKTGLAATLVNQVVHGLAEDREANLTTAEVLLREAIDRKPRASGPYYYLSVVHRVRGRLPQAVDSLERVIEINPSHAAAYAHLGLVLTRMRRAAEGLDHVRYAMRLSPRDPILSYWLSFAATAEMELKLEGQAVEHLQQALALQPRFAPAWGGLAAAYALAGNIEEAKTAVARLRALYPDMTDDALFARLGWQKGSAPTRFVEGLRLAFGREPIAH